MFVFSGDSGEYIFAQSMAYVEHIGGTQALGTVSDIQKRRTSGVKQGTYLLYVQCTYYYLPTTYQQQYVLHIYLDFVRLGLGRITSSYVTRTRRAQARKPKLVLLIKTQVAVLFTTCTASKQTTQTSSFSNLGKSELHFKIGNGQLVQVNLCQKLFFLQNMGTTCSELEIFMY